MQKIRIKFYNHVAGLKPAHMIIKQLEFYLGQAGFVRSVPYSMQQLYYESDEPNAIENFMLICPSFKSLGQNTFFKFDIEIIQ